MYTNSNVLLLSCTRKEFREWINGGNLRVAIIPTGSTEQHNEHMIMGMDTNSVTIVCTKVAQIMYPSVVVTPTVSIGISPHWMNRKGTLTLQRETFLNVVYDICDSLKHHGIDKVLIVNGHGGNDIPLKESMDDFNNKLGIKIEACSYWDGMKDCPEKFIEYDKIPSHAAEFETSIALAEFPDGIRYSNKDLFFYNGWDRRTFDESKAASSDKGNYIIKSAIEFIKEKLIRMMEKN